VSLAKLSAKLRELPRVLAQRVAAAAAPAISTVAKSSFARGEDPHGVPWVPGADGQKVTLRRTGALERFVHYVAIGTKLRVVLGVPYAKYQIGRRPVFPKQGGALPKPYAAALERASGETIRASMEGP
jgi:hypothetical protein